jgi:hypothetical protein
MAFKQRIRDGYSKTTPIYMRLLRPDPGSLENSRTFASLIIGIHPLYATLQGQADGLAG